MNIQKFPINNSELKRIKDFLNEGNKITQNCEGEIIKWLRRVETFLESMHDGKTMNPGTMRDQSPYERFIRGRTYDKNSGDIYDFKYLSSGLGVLDSLVAAYDIHEIFVSEKKLNKLKDIYVNGEKGNNQIALEKLILLIDELNFCWSNNKIYSSIFLQRAIIDLSPKFFNECYNFEAVSALYNGERHSSMQKTLTHLDEATKNIADMHIHGTNRGIISREQADYVSQFDLFIREIISKLEK